MQEPQGLVLNIEKKETVFIKEERKLFLPVTFSAPLILVPFFHGLRPPVSDKKGAKSSVHVKSLSTSRD